MQFNKKKILVVLGLVAAAVAGLMQLVGQLPDAVETDDAGVGGAAGAPSVVVAPDAGL